MKVGTDGVLLGAWTNVAHKKRVLDIGTGTGLLTLMLAQRSNADIDAIEIEKSAFEQACENIKASEWKNRIRIKNLSFRNFILEKPEKYDLVVSNPPYFVDSLPSDNPQKNTARHTQSLSYRDILHHAKSLLTTQGNLALILPALQEKKCKVEAISAGLYLNEILWVKPTPDIAPSRVLLNFSFVQKPAQEATIIIEEYGRHQYSKAYKNLTRDFYLHF